MSSISSRRSRGADGVEIDDGPVTADSTARTFDYARLLRPRDAPRRPVTRISQKPQHLSAPPQPSSEQLPTQESHLELSPPLPAEPEEPACAVGDAVGHALGKRIARAAQPMVSAIFERQQRVLDLVGPLAREIGGFCSDAAIARAGNWEAQIRLDGRLFPNTTLYLTLSPFTLHLRFDTLDSEVKQLLLDHSSMLERELDATLRAWGEARDIQLTIW